MGSTTAARRLRVIKNTDNGVEPDVHVILVPSFSSLEAHHWSPLAGSGGSRAHGRIRLLSFEYTVAINEHFEWDHFLNLSSHLLDSIKALPKLPEGGFKPLLIICHSLGGFLLKQALCDAKIHHLDDRILTAIRGLIFLATPHGSKKPDVLHDRALQILSSKPDVSAKAVARLTENARRDPQHLERLARVSQSFENLGLRRVLTVLEEKETTVKIPRVMIGSRRKSVILVDDEVATTNAHNEVIESLCHDHDNLARFVDEQGRRHERIDQWIDQTLETCYPLQLDTALRDLRAATDSLSLARQPSLPQTTSPVSATTQALSPESSRAATQGSDSNASSPTMKRPRGMSLRRQTARLPCFKVESRLENPHFFAREGVLDRLDRMLLPNNEQTVLYGGDDARCAIIYGTPGVGKSDLAIHFAFTRRERFDAIFWIQAEEHAQLEEDFASIATHLNLEAEDGASNLVVQRDLAKCWLQDQKQQNPQARSGEVHHTAKWLIIFDNADNDGLLEEYRDIVGCGSIIITSRSPARRPLLPQTTLMIDLQPFSNADGAEYLQQRCGLLDDSQSQKAADISERLGGNPLGLTQMSGLINEELMDFDEFVNRYDKPDERFELLRQAGEGDSRERFRRGPVALVFAGDVLFKKPGSRQLLEISSFLDPGKIHQEILLEAAIGKDILEGYPKTQGEFYAARGALLRTSLIQRHQGEEGKDFSVHRLVQDAVRARMDDARILLVVNGVLRLLTHAWGSDALDERYKVEKWRGKPRIVPHVLCIRRFLTQWKKSRTPEVDLRFANLLSEAGWWFFERSQMRDCRDMLDSAMDIVKPYNVEQTFGEFDVRSLVSDLHYGLGALASESNDIDSCKKHFQRLLQLRKDSGKTNSRLADAQNEMGVSLMMQGQVAEALEMFERSIETYKSLGSAYREGMESFPMVNSGQALWALGRLTDAAAILDKGLGMREAAFGRMDKESFRTGRFLHLLGNVRWEQSVLETTDLDRRRTLQAASEQHHRDALQQYRSTIGDLHHRTADVCHKVAQHCLRKGDLRQANSQIAEALKAWSVEPVTFKNEIARTTFLRAQCGKAASMNQEAQVLLIQAAKLREEILQSRGEASDGKAPEELQEKDFDKLVTFWSQ